MSNLEKYNGIFKECFMIEDAQLENLEYQSVEEWDSIGHMNLIAELEDGFEISIETDDVIDFSGYKKGKEILAKYGVEF